MKKIYLNITLVVLTLYFTNSCIEPFEAGTLTFEDVLVVESTITDELKRQQIKLSRTSPIEKDEFKFESNATIQIIENDQNHYTFTEASPGHYYSDNKFKANLGSSYELSIVTNTGNSYHSKKVEISNQSTIDNVYALKEIGADGLANITVNVDSYDPSGNAKYFRYEYIETALFSPQDWNLEYLAPTGNGIQLVLRERLNQEGRYCYRTDSTKTIILAQTAELSETRLKKFPVRSISQNNYMISNRYSILVKQYSQSFEAYNYYNSIKKTSINQSILSQYQPGYFNGNISSDMDEDELIIGFFDVVSVATKRIFFNFSDFFEPEDYPPYFIKCPRYPLEPYQRYWAITNGISLYGGSILEEGVDGGADRNVMQFVPNACGDCRELGTDIKPEFWIDR